MWALDTAGSIWVGFCYLLAFLSFCLLPILFIAAGVLVAKHYLKKRRAAQPATYLHPLKAELGVLVAIVALLVYSAIDLSQWLARQWRRNF
jgi:uncharacterized membrane protein YoaK (UPF0700 family)